MPDWFYRTVSQPLLFRCRAKLARDLALGVMGTLSRLPLGPQIIDILGHMRADSRLQVDVAGVSCASPLGIGYRLDPTGSAWPALAQFGVGLIEVAVQDEPARLDAPPVYLEQSEQTLRYPPHAGPIFGPLAELKIAEIARLPVPILLRFQSTSAASLTAVVRAASGIHQAYRSQIAFFALEILDLAIKQACPITTWTGCLRDFLNTPATVAQPPDALLASEAVTAGSQTRHPPVLLALPATLINDDTMPYLRAALDVGIAGFVVDNSQTSATGEVMTGLPLLANTTAGVKYLRSRLPATAVIICGGAHEPEDALKLTAAGANLLLLDTGLIFSGPGIIKRCNQALLERKFARESSDAHHNPSLRMVDSTWFWTACMGWGMLLGSLLALLIAATRVVLPYDEDFVGLSRVEINQINPRLLAFMAHDRVTLAGTMIAIGLLYVSLSWYGIRRGYHWAMVAVFASAFLGFFTFFTFLGFGYLDPFHAFVTVVLLQLLLLGVRSHLGEYWPRHTSPLRADWTWYWSLWGQLLLILHGVALFVAGVTITTIGCTSVFVHADLNFMRTTTEALTEANPRLLPLVAHDRATFGSMLMASSLVFLLPVLWGWNFRERWLWITMFVAGFAGYLPAIVVHFAVGYTDWQHLLPAFLGFNWFLLGMLLSFPYLWGLHASPPKRTGGVSG
ncbi:MAG: hypothetical protein SFX18_16365 [Pirellulales bacterium]|nr:hypothetical protein [Pirellulales bacterium]